MIEKTENEGIVTLRLAHGKVSALDLELCEALALAFAEIATSDAHAVVLTGTGTTFSAGVDLFRLVDGGRDYAERFVPALSRMLLDLFALPKPVIASVNGHAIAGGCILTLAADYRLMVAGNARIGIPEMLVGVPFPPSVLEAVRFVLPPQHLQMLIYTGRSVTPDDALRYGLIDEVVEADKLASRTAELAQHFATRIPHTFALTKRQLRDKTIDRAKHYAAEFDGEVLEAWSDPKMHAWIREYLAKTIKK